MAAKSLGIVLYEPEELIVVVRGDITLSVLENTLSEHHQWIPTLGAAEHPENILSKAIEEDYYHPRTQSCGMLRTSILGGSFTTKKGETFKSGSRVVKSVAGYDIHRAFCGSHGAFGTIETVTLKVQAKPQSFFHFFAPLSALPDVQQCYPTILEEHNGRLFVELAGYAEDVAYDRQKISALSIEEIDNATAASTIKGIIVDRTKNNSLKSESDVLLSKLISVFKTSKK